MQEIVWVETETLQVAETLAETFGEEQYAPQIGADRD